VITTEDINTWVAAAVNAQGAITGKAWPGRGPDAPAYPYCVFFLHALEAETFSGAKYVQRWQVRAAVYVPIGAPSPISVATALAALNTALVVTAAAVVGDLRNAGEKVLSTRPVTSDEKYAPTMREGKDVLVAGVTAELLCQGDRSVA
jgi:hypothetical protein